MENEETLKRLQVVLTGNTKQLQQAMQEAQTATRKTADDIESSMNKVGNILKTVGKVVAAAISVKAIVDFGKSCIELGSDLNEVQNVVDVTFGSMSSKVDEFSKAAIKQFGLSETAAKQYTSTMGSMLKSMGMTTDTAYGMSTTLTGLAGDMASFYNLDAETAFEKIRSGISGETEPLKQLGINMSVANLEAYALSHGIDKAYSSMTQAEQAMLRYNYLLDATADAQGDFARTSDGWANQTRILAMQFDSLKASIGQGLIMAFTPVLKVINAVMERLTALSDKFRVTVAAITGQELSVDVSSSVSSTVPEDMLAAADAAEETGENLTNGMKKAEKAAKRFLLPFDEIHRLGGEESSPVDVNALDALSDLTALSGMQELTAATDDENGKLSEMQSQLDKLREKMAPVIEKAREMKESFSAGFDAGLGDDFSGRVDGIVADVRSIGDNIKEIFTDEEVTGSADNFLNSVSYAMGQITGSAVSIGTSFAANMIGGIESYLKDSKDRIKQYLADMFNIGSDNAWTVGNIAQTIAHIFEPFGEENGQELTGNVIGIFSDGFMSISELAAKAGNDMLHYLFDPLTANAEGLRQVFDDILKFAASITGTVKSAVDFIGDKANAVYDDHIKPAIDNIKEGITDLVGNVIDFWHNNISPTLDEWSEAISGLWENSLKPMVDQFGDALGSLFDLISALWDKVQPFIEWLQSAFLGTVWPVLKDVIDTAIKIIGDVADALNGVFEIISGVIDFIVGVFTGDWERAWDGAGKVFYGFYDVVDGIISGVIDIIDGLLQSVIDFFAGLGGAIADGIARLVDWGKSLFGGGDDNKMTRHQYQTAAAESAATSNIRGSAYYAMSDNGTSSEDMYNAMRAALEDTDGGDVNLYIDGEQMATATDKARQLRNTRLNPQLA